MKLSDFGIDVVTSAALCQSYLERAIDLLEDDSVTISDEELTILLENVKRAYVHSEVLRELFWERHDDNLWKNLGMVGLR